MASAHLPEHRKGRNSRSGVLLPDNCNDRNCSVRICGTEIRRTKERSELLAEFNEWLRVNKMPPETDDAEVPARPWNILEYLGLL